MKESHGPPVMEDQENEGRPGFAAFLVFLHHFFAKTAHMWAKLAEESGLN